MKSSLKVLALAACVGAVILVDAQRSAPQERGDRVAETLLIGVTILDPGMTLIERFGSPDDIEALSIGGGAVGPAGGFGRGAGRGAPAGAGGGAGAFGGGGPGDPFQVDFLGDPFSTRSRLNQARPGQRPPGGDVAVGAPPGGAGDLGRGSGPGGGGGGGGPRIMYTRWIYKSGSSRYAFVLDKFNRVVQIEAVGLNDGQVGTQRGIRFGSEFADIITAYNVPDAYEISGDTIVLRYLVRDHVAFRLSRLKAKQPHRVTGIVVAAGKQ